MIFLSDIASGIYILFEEKDNDLTPIMTLRALFESLMNCKTL